MNTKNWGSQIEEKWKQLLFQWQGEHQFSPLRYFCFVFEFSAHPVILNHFPWLFGGVAKLPFKSLFLLNSFDADASSLSFVESATWLSGSPWTCSVKFISKCSHLVAEAAWVHPAQMWWCYCRHSQRWKYSCFINCHRPLRKTFSTYAFIFQVWSNEPVISAACESLELK